MRVLGDKLVTDENRLYLDLGPLPPEFQGGSAAPATGSPPALPPPSAPGNGFARALRAIAQGARTNAEVGRLANMKPDHVAWTLSGLRRNWKMVTGLSGNLQLTPRGERVARGESPPPSYHSPVGAS